MKSAAVYWIENNQEIMYAYLALYSWMVLFWALPKLQQAFSLSKDDVTSTFSYKFLTFVFFFNVYIGIKEYIKRYFLNEPGLTIFPL